MTALLEQAFRAASQLPESLQDELAARLLAEIRAEDEFDCALHETAHKLARLTERAIAENRSGLTLPFPE